MHNAFLPKPHEQFDAHLPILIMACQTVESAMLKNKRLEEKILKSPNALHPQLLIIWLVSVETTKPVYCTVTVYDKLMSSSRSSIMRVRHLNESQNPSEFLSIDSNYMRLSRGEVEILSGNSTDCIHMEIMIHEYEHQ